MDATTADSTLLSDALPPFEQMVMDALGHQTRRAILGRLQNGPLAVGALAADLPISRPAVSKHLRILEEARLVAHTSKGASNIFYLDQQGFQAARAYLDSFWDEALTRYQRVAELMAEAQEQVQQADEKGHKVP